MVRSISWYLVALGLLACLVQIPRAASAEQTCDDGFKTDVKSARKVAHSGNIPNPDPALGAQASEVIAFGDVIEIEVGNLPGLLAQAACLKGTAQLVLFLNNRPIPGWTASPTSDPSRNTLFFTLSPETGFSAGTGTKADVDRTWAYILGRPDLTPRDVVVSVGINTRYAMPSSAKLRFRVASGGWLIAWGTIFLVLLAVFIALFRKSSIVREPPIDLGPDTPAWGPYSLARTQAAWWFFVILASYMLIGLVTGNFATSLNATALGLLGIGSGTALLSSVIDSSKSPEIADATRTALAEAKALAERPAAVPPAQQGPALEAARKTLQQIRNPSRNWLLDIVSDKNGVSFHRFQVVGWTVVLTVVFLKGVYETLAMPDFDATLFGLQGLSAATYLGLKIPEPKVATKATV